MKNIYLPYYRRDSVFLTTILVNLHLTTDISCSSSNQLLLNKWSRFLYFNGSIGVGENRQIIMLVNLVPLNGQSVRNVSYFGAHNLVNIGLNLNWRLKIFQVSLCTSIFGKYHWFNPRITNYIVKILNPFIYHFNQKRILVYIILF